MLATTERIRPLPTSRCILALSHQTSPYAALALPEAEPSILKKKGGEQNTHFRDEIFKIMRVLPRFHSNWSKTCYYRKRMNYNNNTTIYLGFPIIPIPSRDI
jgi:hypothetical protein